MHSGNISMPMVPTVGFLIVKRKSEMVPDNGFHTSVCFCLYVCVTSPAIQTALRLQSEGKTSLHQELKLKRRVHREHSQRERIRSSRSSCSSRSSQSDDLSIQELEKMEKDKDRQDLEIESIIQVRGTQWQDDETKIKWRKVFMLGYSHLAARTWTGNQKKRGGGKREEETERSADGVGETAERGWDGKTKLSWLFTILRSGISVWMREANLWAQHKTLAF